MIYISIIFILLFFSAFFSGSETGLTGTNRAKIYKLKSEGDKNAGKVEDLLQNKNRLITTILLGNNLVNIAASALATSIAIKYFGEEGIFYVTVILTLVVLIFAEVLPKTYAINNAEKVALFVAPFFNILVKLFVPITFFVEKTVALFSKILGLDKTNVEDVIHGTDALKGAIEMHHHEGDVFKEDKDMLGSILELAHTEVQDIMKHRKDMETIDINQPAEDILKAVLTSQYSRIPVYENNSDNIIGVLHGKTLTKHLNHDLEGDISKLNIRDVLNKPWFVPETNSLKDQLLSFKEKHSHFALIVDEYGSLQGLLTLEDILEEIVGNIEDEHDVVYHLIDEENDGSYIVDGSIPIRDLNRELDFNLPHEDANTIAGLVINIAQMIPVEGQKFQNKGFLFEVLKRKKNQIVKIKIRETEESDNSEKD